MRTLVGLIALLGGGCYNPRADATCSLQCTANTPGACPAELTCLGGLCRDPAHPFCGALNDGRVVDGFTVDDPPGMYCLGDPAFMRLCEPMRPTNPITPGPVVDTDVDCTRMETVNTVEVCVLVSGDVDVAQPVRVTGARPAVFFVGGTLTINGAGMLDASSYRLGSAGAAANVLCAPPAAAGDANSGTGGAAGGGAGGTLGTTGGAGAAGSMGAGGAGGQAVGVSTFVALRGGCMGGWGGNNDSGNGAGIGGDGGGAIAILAEVIVVDGAVLAYGGGGGGALSQLGGGGGGGAGGTIYLDAQTITINGHVNANGGGGGAGGDGGNGGGRGFEVDLASPTFGGNGGIPNGGISGFGGSGGTNLAGNDAPAADDGGGGGGGGGGVVRIRTMNLLSNGVVSPTATP